MQPAEMRVGAQDRTAAFERELARIGRSSENRKSRMRKDPFSPSAGHEWNTGRKVDLHRHGAAILGSEQGLTYGFSDEVLGLFNGDAKAARRELYDYARANYPGAFAAGETQGFALNSIATAPLTLGKTVMGWRAALPGGTTAKNALTGAGIASVSDSTYQYGQAEGQLLRRGQQYDPVRGTFAAGLGAAIPAVASMVPVARKEALSIGRKLSEALGGRARGRVPGGGAPPAQQGLPGGGGKKPELPMDEASRMARAREMGFDTEQTLYHGTDEDFDQFSLQETRNTTTGNRVFGDGFYFTPDRDRAGIFGANTIEAHSALKKPYVVEAYSKRHLQIMDDRQNLGSEGLTEKLRSEGYDGVVFQTSDGQIDQVMVLDPKDIRRTDAKFDPAQSDSPILTAGIGGVNDRFRGGFGGRFWGRESATEQGRQGLRNIGGRARGQGRANPEAVADESRNLTRNQQGADNAAITPLGGRARNPAPGAQVSPDQAREQLAIDLKAFAAQTGQGDAFVESVLSQIPEGAAPRIISQAQAEQIFGREALAQHVRKQEPWATLPDRRSAISLDEAGNASEGYRPDVRGGEFGNPFGGVNREEFTPWAGNRPPSMILPGMGLIGLGMGGYIYYDMTQADGMFGSDPIMVRQPKAGPQRPQNALAQAAPPTPSAPSVRPDVAGNRAMTRDGLRQQIESANNIQLRRRLIARYEEMYGPYTTQANALAGQ